MTTTNVSTTKMYCACSGKWCEFANLQGFCTLTACCKRVIYDDHTTIIKRTENSSEKPNNCEPQTYVINPQEPTNDDKCFDCDDFFTCGGQCNKIEDEPQTERSE